MININFCLVFCSCNEGTSIARRFVAVSRLPRGEQRSRLGPAATLGSAVRRTAELSEIVELQRQQSETQQSELLQHRQNVQGQLQRAAKSTS